MKGLFKKLGQGMLFILALPFGLIIFALFSVYAIIMFFYTFFSSIPAFFRGENVFGPDELDIAASTRLAEQKLATQQQSVQQTPPPSTTINLYNVQQPQQPGQEQTPPPPPEITYTTQDGVTYRRVTEQEVTKLPEEAIIENEEEQK